MPVASDPVQDRRLAEQIQKEWQRVIEIMERNFKYYQGYKNNDWTKLREHMQELERKLKQVGIDL